MKTFLIRGVPLAMQQDGWWLNSPPPSDGAKTRKSTAPQIWHLGLLVGLIALGDVLVWQAAAGLSLAVFGAAVMLAALSVASAPLTRRRMALVGGGAFLALLPLVELVQPLSVVIAVLGLSAMMVVLAGVDLKRIMRALLRLWPLGMRQSFEDAGQFITADDRGSFSALARRIVLHWMMPLGLGLIFAVLLLEANPIAFRWVEDILEGGLALPAVDRMAFWVCLAPLMWTALSLHRMRERLRSTPATTPQKMGPARQGLINPASTLRGLVLFNAVFALQTGMDVIYLYGGVGLPEGISYAEYAHRGAYPLVLTGLLAGGFALRTRTWVQGMPLMRALLMIWVAQNVALVVSSLVRLELYVDVYGLTHLRMAAAIWMGLTAIGLAMILWQIAHARSNSWLMLRLGALTAVVLYVCAFASLDAVIARYNLSQPVVQDQWYLCKLGDVAKPVIAAYEQTRDRPLCGKVHDIATPQDWREWGFRNWRARTSLAALHLEATP